MSKSNDSGLGGGLYLPNASIPGAIDGVVSDSQLEAGFDIEIPFYKQSYEYLAYLTDRNNPEWYLYFNKSQAFAADKPIRIQVRPKELERLKGQQVHLYYQYADHQHPRASGNVPFTMGTPSSKR